MGINSENNNNTENLKQQENLASAVDGVTSAGKQVTDVLLNTAKSQGKVNVSSDDLAKILKKLGNTAEGAEEALNLLPKKLSDITETMNKNMAYASGKLHDNFAKAVINEKFWKVRAMLAQETDDLREAAEAAEKALKIAEDSNDEQAKAAAERLRDQTKEAYERRKQMTAQNQLNTKLAYGLKNATLKMITDTMSAMWKYYKQLYIDGYKNTVAAVQENYSTITSMSNYSEAEFNALFNKINQQIEDMGLDKLITNADIEKALSESLRAGLKGDDAFYNAFYSQLSAQLGITIDWMGTEFTSALAGMSDEAAKAFMEHTAISLDALQEQYDHNKGLANGLATTISEFTGSLTRQYQLSETAASKLFDSYAIASQELATSDPDLASMVMTDLAKMVESGLANDNAASLFFTNGGSSAELEAMLKAGKADELVATYIDNMQKIAADPNYNGEMLNALSTSLGNFSTANYQALQEYTDKKGSYSKNQAEMLSKLTGSIEDLVNEAHDYTLRTEQEKNEKENNDAVQALALWAAENPGAAAAVESITGGLDEIEKLMVTWMTQSLALQAGNLFSGKNSQGTNMLKNFFKSGTPKSGTGTYKSIGTMKNGFNHMKGTGAEKASRLLNSGASFSNVSKTAGFKNALSGKMSNIGTSIKAAPGKLADLGKTAWNKMKAPSSGAMKLGGAMMIAQGAMMGLEDSGAALASAKADGKVTVGEAANTGLAFLTGHNANLSEEEKMRKAKEGKGGLDWGAAFKNAGKGALIGGGAGMLASPIGGAIGAAAGAVTGFAANLIQQAADMKDYNDYAASSLGKLGDSLGEADKIQKALTQSTSNYLQQVNALSDMEATLAAAKSGEVEMSDREIKLLEKEIELQERKVALAARELGSAEDMINANQDNAELLQKSQKGMDALENITDTISAGGYTESTNFNDMDKEHLQELVSQEDIDNMVAAGLLDKDKVKDLGYEKTAKGILQTMTGSKEGTNWFDNIETDTFSMATAKGGTSGTLYTDLQNNANTAQSNMDSQISTNESLIAQTHKLSGEADYKTLQNAISGIITGYVNKYEMNGDDTATAIADVLETEKSVTDMVAELGSDIPKEDIEKYKAWLKKNGIAKTVSDGKFKKFDGFFATGTDYVPYDNYLALLHRGEQVKTSAEVALDEAKHVASTNTQSAIHDVVLNQTNTIINLLTNIYQVLSSGRADPAKLSTKIKYDLPGAT